MTIILLATLLLMADGEDELAGFRDGASHWRKKRDIVDPPIHPPTAVSAIADNILLHQRDNGGWPPNHDMQRILTPEEVATLLADKDKEDTSFDNRNTYTQIRYLAFAFRKTQDSRYSDAIHRGLAFLLDAQCPTGGWPHSHPNHRDYKGHITILDDVMVGVLALLRDIVESEKSWTFLNAALRQRCRDALQKGNACLLQLQVRVDGQPTVWAGQYHSVTLEPAVGRSFERISLCGGESAEVLRYLMADPDPSPEVVAAVLAGVRWYERSKITGLRVEQVPADTVAYENHVSRFDVVVRADPDAPPLWARCYDIATNQPFFANRDGSRVESLAQVDRERRTGYRWYSQVGRRLLEEDYPAWLSRHPEVQPSADRQAASP
jgi:PelA/Pel-15E family pectate lyase